MLIKVRTVLAGGSKCILGVLEVSANGIPPLDEAAVSMLTGRSSSIFAPFFSLFTCRFPFWLRLFHSSIRKEGGFSCSMRIVLCGTILSPTFVCGDVVPHLFEIS